MREVRVGKDEPLDKALKRFRSNLSAVKREYRGHQDRHLGSNRIRKRYRRKKGNELNPYDDYDDETEHKQGRTYYPPDRSGDASSPLKTFLREFKGLGMLVDRAFYSQARTQVTSLLDKYERLDKTLQRQVDREYERLCEYRDFLNRPDIIEKARAQTSDY